jgi:hypothetical protein
LWPFRNFGCFVRFRATVTRKFVWCLLCVFIAAVKVVLNILKNGRIYFNMQHS